MSKARVLERRQLRRYKTARYVAMVRLASGLGSLFKPHEAAVVDINRRGLRLVTDRSYRKGARLVLALFSDNERIHGIQARVCHLSHEDGEYQLGLMFVDPVLRDQMSPATQNLLNSVEQVVVKQLI